MLRVPLPRSLFMRTCMTRPAVSGFRHANNRFSPDGIWSVLPGSGSGTTRRPPGGPTVVSFVAVTSSDMSVEIDAAVIVGCSSGRVRLLTREVRLPPVSDGTMESRMGRGRTLLSPLVAGPLLCVSEERWRWDPRPLPMNGVWTSCTSMISTARGSITFLQRSRTALAGDRTADQRMVWREVRGSIQLEGTDGAGGTTSRG